MKQKILLLLQFIGILIIMSLINFTVYGSTEDTIRYRFDDVDDFLEGADIGGLTFDSAVTRSSSIKMLKGERYENYVEFKNDGNDIISKAISFKVPGNCSIYITACASNSKNCHLVVNNAGSKIATPAIQTFIYNYTGNAGTLNIYIEPYSNVDDFAKIRIFDIAIVPNKTYSSLDEDEEIYWSFDEFSFDGISSGTITSDYTESGLTIHASDDKDVSVVKSEKDTEAGFRYYSAVDLNGSGNSRYRSFSFFAYPDSDIFITAYHTGSSSEGRTLYFTNDYGMTFYDDAGTNQDVTVNSTATLSKVSYNGNGETVHFCSSDSAIRICDIRVVRKEENDTSIIENGSWNFSSFSSGAYTAETTLNGLTVTPGRGASIIMAGAEAGYTKYLKLYYAPYQNAAKMKFTIGDSTGSDKYRTNKIISITLKGSSHSGSMYVVDKYGRLITKFDFTTELATYNLRYDGYSQDLIFYPRTETAYVYELTVKDEDKYFGEVFDTASITKGKTYTYFCTAYNIDDVADKVYVVSYNQNALKVKYVGYGDETKTYNNVVIGDNITIISNTNGFLEFKVDEDFENWSGILALVEFEALSTGDTTIGFDYYKGWRLWKK